MADLEGRPMLSDFEMHQVGQVRTGNRSFARLHEDTRALIVPPQETQIQTGQSLYDQCYEILALAASMSIMICSVVIYNGVFIGRVLPAVGKTESRFFFSLAFNLVFGLMFWSWLQAHLEDPGGIPQRWHDFVHSTGDALNVEPAFRGWQPGLATFCDQCCHVRPERAHHCGRCQRCFLRLDHHCPFIKNCVGFNNHKYFLLVVLYGALCSLIGIFTTLPELVRCVQGLVLLCTGAGAQQALGNLTFADAALLLCFGCIATGAAMVFPPMALLHFSLAAHNQTKIENNFDNMPNPYKLGTPMENLSQVLGAPGCDWFVPVRPAQPLTDGLSFQRGDMDLPDHLKVPLPPGSEEAERLWRIRYRMTPRRRMRDLAGGEPPVCTACMQ